MDRLQRGLAVALLIVNACVLAYVLAAALRVVPTWFDRPVAGAAAAPAEPLHPTRHAVRGEECDHLLAQLRTASLELHGGHLPEEEAQRIEALRGTDACAAGSESVESMRAELATAFRQQGREPPQLLAP